MEEKITGLSQQEVRRKKEEGKGLYVYLLQRRKNRYSKKIFLLYSISLILP